MKIALAQINATVGDFAGNLARIGAALERGCESGADLVVLPEQAIPGYPAGDLLEREDFRAAAVRAFQELVDSTRGRPAALLTGTLAPAGDGPGKPVFNSAALVQDGRVLGMQHKTLLPTYDVFDEARYFQPAPERHPLELMGRRLGVAICEDAWNDSSFWPRPLYELDPVDELARQGAEALIIPSASPFSLGRRQLRLRMLQGLARRRGIPLVLVNLVGGNTSLIFDGNSLALDRRGEVIARCRAFAEDFAIADIDKGQPAVEEPEDEVAEAHDALVLGARDYLHKNGYRRAVIGLSGGIDSSVTAVIAAAALGAENVIGASMPSRYSSEGSEADARLLAERLGIVLHRLPIEDLFGDALRALAPAFAGLPEDVTEENLQARLRGLILMALSNKLGALLLSTGNKSELAVGYCTLYGDMCGGLAVISDVPKTLVYRLARYINRSGEVIPRAVIEKPPSAELRPGQVDQDTLPPYETLDAIAEAYIEKGADPARIAAMGFDRELVLRVIAMIDRAEFKRQQAAPGLRITARAFGPGRRYPITQRYRYDWSSETLNDFKTGSSGQY